MRTSSWVGTAFVAAVLAAGAGVMSERGIFAQTPPKVTRGPMFEVDPSWPKPLPKNWIIGSPAGIGVDSNDHIWVVHQPARLTGAQKAASLNPPGAECCVPAPPVLEFDQAGNVLRSWGGPADGYEWPEWEHGLYIDYKGNIWIAGRNDVGGQKPGGQVLKFTKDGKFLLQIGHRNTGSGSNDPENFGAPTGIAVDPSTNEAFVSDGYYNRRVIVFDADTGRYKRHWGAYGNRPSDDPLPPYNPADPPAKQFIRAVHCVGLSTDGLLYVCDRGASRLQVFRKDGTFVKETMILPNTRSIGSTCDVGFSRDAQQRYLYVADCGNHRVHILERDSLQPLSWFGGGGRNVGQLLIPHNLAVDLKGNIYTGETLEASRLQRFLFKGVR